MFTTGLRLTSSQHWCSLYGSSLQGDCRRRRRPFTKDLFTCLGSALFGYTYLLSNILCIT